MNEYDATNNAHQNQQFIHLPLAVPGNAGPFICPVVGGGQFVTAHQSARSATAVNFAAGVVTCLHTDGISDCMVVAVYCNNGGTHAGGMVHFGLCDIATAAAYTTIFTHIPLAQRPNTFAVIATSDVNGRWFAGIPARDIEAILINHGVPANHILFYYDGRGNRGSTFCLRANGMIGNLS